MNGEMTIHIGSDHAGFEYKTSIAAYLTSKGYEYQDHGTHNKESADYPPFAHSVAVAVSGITGFGILICGSANGVCMTANKHNGIRAAVCWNEETARLARQHNDANILCLPARFITQEEALRLVQIFIETPFEGGRHQRRVQLIDC